MPVDLSLYLVTDSTPAILKGRDLCTVVEQAIQGGELSVFFLSIYTSINHILGVTVVQYRDKSSDTSVLVENARKLHQITKKYNVPLLINDRVDVALAIGAEGVHLGQDDMSLSPRLSVPDLYPDVIPRLQTSKAASASRCYYWSQHINR